jgi:hypothetical protein
MLNTVTMLDSAVSITESAAATNPALASAGLTSGIFPA